jgi:hypothetical protein
MTLKVLSYNIREGGDDRLPGVAAIIRKQQPDAVALLEATSRANALTLAQDLEMQLVFGEANNGMHVAWLSRLPIQRERNHRPAALAKTLLEIEAVWEGAHWRRSGAGVRSLPDLGGVPRDRSLLSERVCFTGFARRPVAHLTPSPVRGRQ